MDCRIHIRLGKYSHGKSICQGGPATLFLKSLEELEHLVRCLSSSNWLTSGRLLVVGACQSGEIGQSMPNRA